MKKLIAIVCIAASICLSSCKNNESSEDQDDYNDDITTLSNDDTTSEATDVYSYEEDNTEVNDTQSREKVDAGQPLTNKEKSVDPVTKKTYSASVLTATSINLIESNGKPLALRFGQPSQSVISSMSEYLGKPDSNKMDADCGGKTVRIVQWEENITLLFTESNGTSQFSGWNLQARDDNATKFKTTSGLTVGVTQSSLNMPSGSKPSKTSLGYLQQKESISVLFPSDEKDAKATYVFAGVNCYAIEKGATPESEKN